MNKTLSIIAAVLALIFTSNTASANRSCEEDWKEKMMSEKIAFLTLEVGLTPEEAQTFWPVYNTVEKEKYEALANVFRAYKELSKATEEGKTGKALSDLLDKYLAAQKELNNVENGIAEQYKSVLPVEKVVKLYLAEEKFRRNSIRKLHDGRPAPKK